MVRGWSARSIALSHVHRVVSCWQMARIRRGLLELGGHVFRFIDRLFTMLGIGAIAWACAAIVCDHWQITSHIAQWIVALSVIWVLTTLVPSSRGAT